MKSNEIIGPNSCNECSGDHGMHMPDCPNLMCNWKIEYEIPPLRAIYFAEAENCTEAQAREMVRTEQPLWKIRKMERL